MMRGMEVLTKAVGVTLGPKGRNVIIQMGTDPPLVTSEGALVANQVNLEDRFEDIGAQILREAGAETGSTVGDGTTTAMVLATAIFRHGALALAAGEDPGALKRGIDQAADVVDYEISNHARLINLDGAVTCGTGLSELRRGAPISNMESLVGSIPARLGIDIAGDTKKLGLFQSLEDHPVNSFDLLPRNFWSEGRRAGFSADNLDQITDIIHEFKNDKIRHALEVRPSYTADVASDLRLQLTRIATAAAHGDTAIGDIVSQAIGGVGPQGFVITEESRHAEMEVEINEGIRLPAGYTTAKFATDEIRMRAELDQPYVLLSNGIIADLKPILPLLEAVVQSGRSLLIIADGVEGEALNTLVINKLRGGLKVVAVSVSRVGMADIFDDLALLTGGQVVSENLGIRLENVTLNMLGNADKAIATAETTVIINGKGRLVDVQQMANRVRVRLEEATTGYDSEVLRERLGRLRQRVATIRVGGGSEFEMKVRRQRIEAALQATRAALDEGVVPGGGVALARASKILSDLLPHDLGERRGVEIVRKALQATLIRIAENAGIEGRAVAARLLETNEYFRGFDAETGELVDTIDAGIINESKVIRAALRRAVSLVGLLLTADAVVAEKKTH